MSRQLLAVLLLTTVYAVMRYAAFGDVSLVHLPGYLLNKGISMAAVVALFMAAQGLVRSQSDTVRFWSRASAHLAFVHILLSLALLSKGNYPKFFDGDRMNLTGEGMLLMGVLAGYCFWRLGATRLRSSVGRHLTSLGCALVAGHLLIMGYGGWLQPQKWHGGLPPITLICFLLAMASLFVFLVGSRRLRFSITSKTSQPDKIGRCSAVEEVAGNVIPDIFLPESEKCRVPKDLFD